MNSRLIHSLTIASTRGHITDDGAERVTTVSLVCSQIQDACLPSQIDESEDIDTL